MKIPRLPLRPLRWGVLLLTVGTAAAAPRLAPKVVGVNGDITKVDGNYDLPASLGTRVGGNLFHTFVQFDLASGEVATFGGPAGISNILARVTGSRSYIDGTIKSTVPDANFFLINANGVTFGQHAQLDVPASFAVTTADVIKLGDGGKFDAIDPSKDSLTAGPISAYGFLGKQTNSVAVDYSAFLPRTPRDPGATLAVKPGFTLTLAGGAVNLTGGDTSASGVSLNAPGGRLELAAVNKGDLKADLSAGPKLGEVNLTNVSLNSEGAGSRGLAMQAGTANLSQVTGYTSGAMDVHVTGAATIADGTVLKTRTKGDQVAGNFSIRGGSVVMRGTSEIGSIATETSTAAGRAGNVAVKAGNLSIREGSKVASNTFGLAPAGAVSVRASNIRLTGDKSPEPTGIFSNSVVFGLETTPTAGNVHVVSNTLLITGGGSISGDTFGGAHGGSVNVQSKDIKIIAGNSDVKTGIFSDSDSAGTGGDGGSVRVTAETLDIENGGLISTKTVGSGKGGDTTVAVRELTINRGSSPAFTGIAADSATNDSPTLPAHFAGPGGNVNVTAETARLLQGGQISASTATQGKGGDVLVDAKNLTVSGHVNDAFSNISADSRAQAGKGGKSGSVIVNSDQLTVDQGGRISATTFGSGMAGAVRVTAASATLTAATGEPFTGILAVSASPTLAGQGGSVLAQFGTLTMNGGGIAGNTLGPGRGGDVFVTAGTARLTVGGAISADTSGLGMGGSVHFAVGDLFISGAGTLARTGVFSGSSAVGPGGIAGLVQVDATSAQLLDGGSIAAASTSSGAGGSVVVNATTLLLDRTSTIAASATGLGVAGSVAVNVIDPLHIMGGSSLSTTSALSEAGTVAVTSASDVILEGGSSLTVKALVANAGSISIITKHMLLMKNSNLIAEAGLNGGNIFVDPQFIILDHSIISANAVMTGGNILLTADQFLSSETPVTATGSTAGTVEISAPALDLNGALGALNAQLVDASIRFQERCAMRLGADVSTFLVLGRGGVENFPGETPLVLSRPLEPPLPKR